MTLPACYRCQSQPCECADGERMTPTITNEYGLYDGSWKGVIVNEAFAHPAKFSRKLIEWIVDHGLRARYWKPGDLLADCFGGVGLGGIVAASRGLRWIGVELELTFQRMASGYDCPGMSKAEWVRWFGRWKRCREFCPDCQTKALDWYVQDSGEIPSRPAHRFVGNFDLHRHTWQQFGDPLPVIVQGDSREFAAIVGEVCCVVTSPPYVANDKSDRTGAARDAKRGFSQGQGCFKTSESYGTTPGQIGSLRSGHLTFCDGCVTSPPYQHGIGQAGGKNEVPGRGDSSYYEAACHGYGTAPGQIGNTANQTYWEAVRQVYEQVYLALKPGAVFCAVIKDYVSKGKRVPLCDDTCTLLNSVGFEVFERTRAWVVQETREPSLFGDDIVKTKSRKSFFRKLAESKGSPPIDWEEVIWCRKPTASAKR